MSEHVVNQVDGPIAHLHIPKTAGTSLRSALIGSFGAENTLCYYQSKKKCIRASDRFMPREASNIDALKSRAYQRSLYGLLGPVYRGLTALIEQPRLIDPSDLRTTPFSVLTGHLDPELIGPQLPDSTTVITIVREPLERTRSHYEHWRRTGGEAELMGTQIPFSEEISFEEFAMSQEQRNYQSRLLSAFARDCLATSVGHIPIMFEYLDMDTDTLPNLNIGQYKPDRYKDPGFVREFESAHSDDMALYNSVSANALQPITVTTHTK